MIGGGIGGSAISILFLRVDNVVLPLPDPFRLFSLLIFLVLRSGLYHCIVSWHHRNRNTWPLAFAYFVLLSRFGTGGDSGVLKREVS